MSKILLIEEEKGLTLHSKRYCEKYLSAIGKVSNLILSSTPVNWQTIIQGEKGELRCYGFSWGYGGEGPSGLRWLISKIKGIDYYGSESQELRTMIVSIPQNTTNYKIFFNELEV